jgi:hypothetical protein
LGALPPRRHGHADGRSIEKLADVVEGQTQFAVDENSVDARDVGRQVEPVTPSSGVASGPGRRDRVATNAS